MTQRCVVSWEGGRGVVQWKNKIKCKTFSLSSVSILRHWGPGDKVCSESKRACFFFCASFETWEWCEGMVFVFGWLTGN